MPESLNIRLIPSKGLTNHAKDSSFSKACHEVMRLEKLETGISFSRIPGIPFHFCGDFCFKEKFLRTKPKWMQWLPRYRYYLKREKYLFDAPSRSHIFFLAQSEKETFQKHYQIALERHSLLPPWLKRPETTERTEQQNREHLLDPIQVHEDTPFILFVGSDFYRKGLDKAIEALAHLCHPQVHLIVCGQDDPKPFQKIAKVNQVANRIHFLGPRDDIADWMRSAACLLHPARAEPAGMVLIEALTHLLPVVCSANCGYASHVQEAGCYPIAPDANAKDIAKLIGVHLGERDSLRQTIRHWLDAENRYLTAQIMIEKMLQKTKTNSP
jgi:UDP-glucose:(heptosyl)LPS alpha-1,3-glucosyltransferase